MIWAALREKVSNGLSRCHTKRRTGALGRARPSFGMTPTFYFFGWKIFLFSLYIVLGEKTQAIRDLFALHRPYLFITFFRVSRKLSRDVLDDTSRTLKNIIAFHQIDIE